MSLSSFHNKGHPMAQPLIEIAKDLTLALIENNLLAPEDMRQQLAKTHASLLELKAREDDSLRSGVDRGGEQVEGTPAPPDWRKSIKKYAIECLICGQTFKQLSARHLRQHDLDPRTYRQQFGIPRTQALSAKETTAMRRHIVQQSRPWEKAPTYLKAHEQPPSPARPKSVRKKAASSNP
jgi:predicted transcriptional regulator